MKNDFENEYHSIERSLYLVAIGYLRNTEDAKDAVQETAITGYSSYQTLKDKNQFKRWMTKILINKCLDFLRKKRTQEKYMDKIVDSANILCEIPTEEIEMMELIGRLPLKIRPYIILRFYHDLTYREVANILHVPEATAKSRTKLALTKLECLWEDKVHEEF